MSRPLQKALVYGLIIGLTTLLDQSVKVVAPALLPVVYNSGVFLGLGTDYSLYLAGAGIGIVGWLVIKQGSSVPAALLIGGSVSNLIDRLRFGYVVDYIDTQVLPVFNLADVVIVLGIVLLIKDWAKAPNTKHQLSKNT